MKLSETISGMWGDLQNVSESEMISITFAGITWKMKISSFKKIFEYANKYIESKKA